MAHNDFHYNRIQVRGEAVDASYNGQSQRFKRADFEKFLGHYEAVSGWGAAVLAEDLVKAYPDAKVILTMRELRKWLERWNETIVATQRWWRPWRWVYQSVADWREVLGGMQRPRSMRGVTETHLIENSKEGFTSIIMRR
jgi:hypothetical protein